MIESLRLTEICCIALFQRRRNHQKCPTCCQKYDISLSLCPNLNILFAGAASGPHSVLELRLHIWTLVRCDHRVAGGPDRPGHPAGLPDVLPGLLLQELQVGTIS